MGKKNDIVIDFLSNDEVFAALFNGYLFAGKSVIQAKNLKEIDGKTQFFLTGSNANNKNTYEVIKRERDVVREVVIGDLT